MCSTEWYSECIWSILKRIPRISNRNFGPQQKLFFLSSVWFLMFSSPNSAGRSRSVIWSILTLLGFRWEKFRSYSLQVWKLLILHFISISQILSYICLRNIHEVTRKFYSTFFSWIGTFSLELFICQYHIWLANDTHNVLVLIPNLPLVNGLFTSLILLCFAHEINRITNSVCKMMNL